MSEVVEATEAAPETEATEPKAEETAEATQTEAPESDPLPEWAREKLTKANNEAARYRHEAKEARNAAREEATTEFESRLQELADEKAALAAELENARSEQMKFSAALSVGIPVESATEFAELLKGTTTEEVMAHAEKLKGLFGANQKSDRAVDPSQGLGGGKAVNPESDFGSFILSQLSR